VDVFLHIYVTRPVKNAVVPLEYICVNRYNCWCKHCFAANVAAVLLFRYKIWTWQSMVWRRNATSISANCETLRCYVRNMRMTTCQLWNRFLTFCMLLRSVWLLFCYFAPY